MSILPGVVVVPAEAGPPTYASSSGGASAQPREDRPRHHGPGWKRRTHEVSNVCNEYCIGNRMNGSIYNGNTNQAGSEDFLFRRSNVKFHIPKKHK